jgi:hypothetical protein
MMLLLVWLLGLWLLLTGWPGIQPNIPNTTSNIKSRTGTSHNIFICYLKGPCHEIFDPQFFSSINTPGPPDSWAKAVSNINSYSREIFDYENRLRAMHHCAESLFCVSHPKFFYFILHTIGREGPLWMVFC